jgi:methyltransferase-like protein 23
VPASKIKDPLLSLLPLETIPLAIGGRDWRVTVVRDQDALLDIAERFDQIPYGLLLWESAVALAEMIAARPGELSGKRVLELGCGVGLSGVVAQSLGGNVAQTDHEPRALRLSALNAELNQVDGVTQFQADWRDWMHSVRYDLILGADIVYERAVHLLLPAIFAQNLASGGEIWLADPGRPHTLDFLSALENDGWRGSMEVVKIPDVSGRSGKPNVDVTLVRLRRRATA